MYSKENAEKHVSSFLCYFCERVFDNCQALEGHHRAHQWEIRARKSWNNPDLFSKSIAGSSTNANLLPSTQSLSSSGGTNNNMSRVPDRASFLVGFSNNICSNGTTHLNSSKFFRENLGNIGTPSTMSSALSASSAKAECCYEDEHIEKAQDQFVPFFGKRDTSGKGATSYYGNGKITSWAAEFF